MSICVVQYLKSIISLSPGLLGVWACFLAEVSLSGSSKYYGKLNKFRDFGQALTRSFTMHQTQSQWFGYYTNLCTRGFLLLSKRSDILHDEFYTHFKNQMQQNKENGELGLYLGSSEASPTLWSCYANISMFIDRIGSQFLKKWIMIMI